MHFPAQKYLEEEFPRTRTSVMLTETTGETFKNFQTDESRQVLLLTF
jgi:hypothetical protein